MPLYNILKVWWTWEERGHRYRQLRNYGVDPKLARRARDLSPKEYGKIFYQLLRARLGLQASQLEAEGGQP